METLNNISIVIFKENEDPKEYFKDKVFYEHEIYLRVIDKNERKFEVIKNRFGTFIDKEE